jgi:hypothetical protein
MHLRNNPEMMKKLWLSITRIARLEKDLHQARQIWSICLVLPESEQMETIGPQQFHTTVQESSGHDDGRDVGDTTREK